MIGSGYGISPRSAIEVCSAIRCGSTHKPLDFDQPTNPSCKGLKVRKERAVRFDCDWAWNSVREGIEGLLCSLVVINSGSAILSERGGLKVCSAIRVLELVILSERCRRSML